MDRHTEIATSFLHQRIYVLLVLVGSSLAAATYHVPTRALTSPSTIGSTASTVDILRNIEKTLALSRKFNKQKVVKQDDAGTGQDGAANALAYLTDSFGGQLAGQILSVILSSVTGDVRGILGNSVNLFQSEDGRDRAQLFLDELANNFLKFTGLSALTTTKAPQLGSATGPTVTLHNGGSSQQVQAVQAVPVSSLGSSGTPALYGSQFGVGTSSGFGSVSSSGYGSGSSTGFGSGLSSIGVNAAQLQQQQVANAQQPIIYVLPALSNVQTDGTSGTTATKTNTRNKPTTSSNIDDDSEEDRDRERKIY